MHLKNADIGNVPADGRWDRHPDALLAGDWLFFADNPPLTTERFPSFARPPQGIACLPSPGNHPGNAPWERVLISPPLGSDLQFLSWWRAVVRLNGFHPISGEYTEAA